MKIFDDDDWGSECQIENLLFDEVCKVLSNAATIVPPLLRPQQERSVRGVEQTGPPERSFGEMGPICCISRNSI
jgi:hypothetical protein